MHGAPVQWTARWIAPAVGMLVILIAAALVAQFQANVSASNRVNNQLYGGGFQGTVRYTGQTNLLASEQRYANWRAGDLPSQIRGREMAVGPLPSAGNIAYAPKLPPGATQIAGTSKPPLTFASAVPSAATPTAQVPLGTPAGTIRYSKAETSGAAMPVTNFAAAPLSATPLSPVRPVTAVTPVAYSPSPYRPVPYNPSPAQSKPSSLNADLIPESGSMIQGTIRYSTPPTTAPSK